MPEEGAAPDQDVGAASVTADKGDVSAAEPSPVPEEATEVGTVGNEEVASKEAPAVSSEEDVSIDVDTGSDSDGGRGATLLTHVPQRRAPEVDRDPDSRTAQKEIAIDVDGLDESFDEDEEDDEDEDEDEDEDGDGDEDIEPQGPTATIDLTGSVEGTPPRRQHELPDVDDDDDDELEQEAEGDGESPVDADTTAEDALGSEAEPLDASEVEHLDASEWEVDNGESEAEPTGAQNEPAGEADGENGSAALEGEPEQDAADSRTKDAPVEEEADVHAHASPSEEQTASEGKAEAPSSAETVRDNGTGGLEAKGNGIKPEGSPMPEEDVALEQPAKASEGIQAAAEEGPTETETTQGPAEQATPVAVHGDDIDGDEVLEEEDDAGDVDETPSDMAIGVVEGRTAPDNEASEEKTAFSEARAGDEKPEMVPEVTKEEEKPALAEGEAKGEKSPFEALDEDDNKKETGGADTPITSGGQDVAVSSSAEDDGATREHLPETNSAAEDKVDEDKKLVRKDSEKPTPDVKEIPSARARGDDEGDIKGPGEPTAPMVAKKEEHEGSDANQEDKPKTDADKPKTVSASDDTAALDSALVEAGSSASPHVGDAMEVDNEREAGTKMATTTDVQGGKSLLDEKPTHSAPTVNATDLRDTAEPRQTDSKAADVSKASVTAPAILPSSPAADPSVPSGEGKVVTGTSGTTVKSSDETKGTAKEMSLPLSTVSATPTSASPQLSSGPSATITTPMFGIEAPNRTGPVSFSSPPSFHRPRLSPNATPFVPAALRTESAPTPSVGIPGSGGKRKTPEEPTRLATPAEVAKGIVTDELQRPILDSVEATTPVAKPSATLEASTPQGTDKQKQDQAAPKPVLKKLRPEQTLCRIPIKGTSGGMIYRVENVIVFVKEGSSKPVRRGALCTIELKTRPREESTMEFSEGRDQSKTVFASLSSTKDNVRIKRVVNRSYVMAVTVLGPSGQEKGGDVAKYFLHLQEHTFQIFYDACMKFVLVVVAEKDRPKTVRFQEPPGKSQQPAGNSVSSALKKPRGNQDRVKVPKVRSLDQRQLLLKKMEALKKKKAERSSDASPKRDHVHLVTESAHKAPKSSAPDDPIARRSIEAPQEMDLSSGSKPSASVKSNDPVVKPSVATLAKPQSIVGPTSSTIQSKLKLLTPKTRQVPSSPKKRAAFRIDERGESSLKKARLNVPKKRMAMDANAKETARKEHVANAFGSRTASKDQTDVAVGTARMDIIGQSHVPAKVPAATSKSISVVLKQPPSGVQMSFEEKERLALDSKRLVDLLAGIKAAGNLSILMETHTSPTSLQRCQPGNASDFFDRLHTFRPSTWRGFASDHALSPVECARRGWYNSGVDRLTSTEGAEIAAQLESCQNYDSLTKEEERVRNLILGQGHKLLSGWVGESCPVEFETLEGSTRMYSTSDLKNNADQLRKTDAVKILDSVGAEWETGLEELGLADKCGKLAAFNWRARITDEQDLDLHCMWCNRCVLLAPECLAGVGGAGSMSFNPRRSHYPFCPFCMTEDAAKRNAMAMGTASRAATGLTGSVATDRDIKMSDA